MEESKNPSNAFIHRLERLYGSTDLHPISLPLVRDPITSYVGQGEATCTVG